MLYGAVLLQTICVACEMHVHAVDVTVAGWHLYLQWSILQVLLDAKLITR